MYAAGVQPQDAATRRVFRRLDVAQREVEQCHPGVPAVVQRALAAADARWKRRHQPYPDGYPYHAPWQELTRGLKYRMIRRRRTLEPVVMRTGLEIRALGTKDIIIMLASAWYRVAQRLGRAMSTCPCGEVLYWFFVATADGVFSLALSAASLVSLFPGMAR